MFEESWAQYGSICFNQIMFDPFKESRNPFLCDFLLLLDEFGGVFLRLDHEDFFHLDKTSEDIKSLSLTSWEDGFRSRDFRTDHPGISNVCAPQKKSIVWCRRRMSPSLLCTLLCCSFPLQSLAFSLLHRALQPLHLWTAQKVVRNAWCESLPISNNAIICCMPQWHLVIIVLHGEKMLETKTLLTFQNLQQVCMISQASIFSAAKLSNLSTLPCFLLWPGKTYISVKTLWITGTFCSLR